jgi:hypothetical protein
VITYYFNSKGEKTFIDEMPTPYLKNALRTRKERLAEVEKKAGSPGYIEGYVLELKNLISAFENELQKRKEIST